MSAKNRAGSGVEPFPAGHHLGPAAAGEYCEERIPLCVHLAAVVHGQRRPDQRLMTGQHLRVIVFPSRPSSAVEPSMSVNKSVRVSTLTA